MSKRLGPEVERRQGYLEVEKPPYEIVGTLERFNERENVQARKEYEPGTREWELFYTLHPEWEEGDQAVRKRPGLGMVGSSLDGLLVAALGMAIQQLSCEEVVDGPSLPVRQELDPRQAADKVKGLAYFLGADLVRTGPLNPAWIYSHVGRWQMSGAVSGTAIELDHPHAISIAVSMDQELVRCGPVLPNMIGTLRVYQRLAVISATLASYLRMLGYSARAHNLWDYQVLCVPVAVDAGVGELSRSGFIINREMGNAFRLATVTTDLPLGHDRPVDLGVREFCQECKICADYCPSGAITRRGQQVVRGVKKWVINDQACFDYWCKTGTDCGLCIAVCPWNKKLGLSHEAGRRVAVKGKWGAKALLALERIFYGGFRPEEPPAWFEEPSREWRSDMRL